MKKPGPVGLMLIGLFLSVMGVVLPLLMVIHVVTSTFFLNFLAYGAMVTGLFLGIIGAATYARLNKKN
jgi:hypothetical protein